MKAFYDKKGYHTASPTFTQAFSTGNHHHNKDLHMVGIAGEYIVQIDGETVRVHLTSSLFEPLWLDQDGSRGCCEYSKRC